MNNLSEVHQIAEMMYNKFLETNECEEWRLKNCIDNLSRAILALSDPSEEKNLDYIKKKINNAYNSIK